MRLKKPSTQLETALVAQAELLSIAPDASITNVLDLFLALSVYKCQIQHKYKGDPDQVQINLIKNAAQTGLRIYRVGKGNDTARVIQYIN